jgi:hypothetical protein
MALVPGCVYFPQNEIKSTQYSINNCLPLIMHVSNKNNCLQVTHYLARSKFDGLIDIQNGFTSATEFKYHTGLYESGQRSSSWVFVGISTENIDLDTEYFKASQKYGHTKIPICIKLKGCGIEKVLVILGNELRKVEKGMFFWLRKQTPNDTHCPPEPYRSRSLPVFTIIPPQEDFEVYNNYVGVSLTEGNSGGYVSFLLGPCPNSNMLLDQLRNRYKLLHQCINIFYSTKLGEKNSVVQGYIHIKGKLDTIYNWSDNIGISKDIMDILETELGNFLSSLRNTDNVKIDLECWDTWQILLTESRYLKLADKVESCIRPHVYF